MGIMITYHGYNNVYNNPVFNAHKNHGYALHAAKYSNTGTRYVFSSESNRQNI